MVLIFVPDLYASLPTLEPFAMRRDEFLSESSLVCVVAKEEPGELVRFAGAHELDVELLSDADGSLSAELNLESACRPVVLLADRDGVVCESVGFPNIHVDGVLDCVRRLNAA